ncbi:MAG: hypothetical protein DWQ06_01040 [Calditrichaeota bacterium]|nr:MAG: hypothetical protein DWQ06_01040 [Calditrichota bacterium]
MIVPIAPSRTKILRWKRSVNLFINWISIFFCFSFYKFVG